MKKLDQITEVNGSHFCIGSIFLFWPTLFSGACSGFSRDTDNSQNPTYPYHTSRGNKPVTILLNLIFPCGKIPFCVFFWKKIFERHKRSYTDD